MVRRSIVWFRQDLRLADNEALVEAIKSSDEVIPVFVFDPRLFLGTTKFGFRKTGRYRASFILESVIDLRRNLRKKGNELLVRVGKPEVEIAKLADQLKTSWVFCNRERTQEEVDVQDRLERNLWSIGQEVRFSRGKMLYYTQDLPFPVTHTPDQFTSFRKEVENFTTIRKPLAVPAKIPATTEAVEAGEVPTMASFGYKLEEPDQRSVIEFRGGEIAALQRLEHYFWESKSISHYKETRNQMLGADFSSKLSPWLAQGCISPKTVYAALKKYEKSHGANESTYWLFFELLWRDFFRLMGKKHGNRIFQKGGIQQRKRPELIDDMELFEKWASGTTGVPLVDANMHELNKTGFMSNRGRQIVSSFLINALKINWQLGAEYFESLLIDYDPCSNYGNWNYIAGVGSDPRKDRYFNIASQTKRYDPELEYINTWAAEYGGQSFESIKLKHEEAQA